MDRQLKKIEDKAVQSILKTMVICFEEGNVFVHPRIYYTSLDGKSRKYVWILQTVTSFSSQALC